MSLTSNPAISKILQYALPSGIFTLPGLKRLARSLFITLPRVLFGSHLTPRSASFIMLLCLPAILLFVGISVPTMIFQSPDQAAYFYFANSLSNDLSCGYMLALAVLCMFVALTLPAATQDPYSSPGH